MFDILLQLIVNGLMIGGVYAISAMSLAIIYKATQVFNFAAGEIMTVGMFTAFSLMQFGLPLWISAPIAVAVTVVLGLAMERGIMRRLIGQPIFASVMATFGMLFVLRGLQLIIWKGVQARYEFPLPGENIKIGQIVISNDLTWTFVMAALAVVFVAIFFNRTKVGLGMRASAEQQQLAQARGIPVSWILSVTWMLAAAICGVAGVFVSYRLGVNYEVSSVGLAAFPAVLLGGIESIPGALVGGIIVGLAISLTAGLISPAAATIAPFIILLIVLMFRTEGLFGEERIERI